MKASVRCNALTMAQLRAQEKHGKRQDMSSQNRRIRNLSPIVGGGLNLAERLNAHTEDTKRNAGAKNVALHFIVRFPPEVLGDDAPPLFQGKSKEMRQRQMAVQAAKFINEVHGGEAVFALRVDRDEQGETIVDVFACPKYVKTTKKAEATWTSLTKFGKELAVKHQDEIRRRSKNYEGTKPITSPRAIGMALQSEFADFFERTNGMRLVPKNDKDRPGKDRLEVEEWRLRQMRQDAEDEARNIRDKAQSDENRASKKLMQVSKALNDFRKIYNDIRQSLPRIRQILTWEMAPKEEKEQAREDRKKFVPMVSFLRKTIRESQGMMSDMSGTTEEPAPEADGPSF